MSRRLALTSAAIVAFVAAFIAVVIVKAWPVATLEVMRERSPIAWLSSVLLAASAIAALIIFLREREHLLFGALAAGLFALALDERFMGHETLKAAILRSVFDYDRAAMWIWGDLPLTLVPIVGAAVLWRLRAHFSARPVRVLLVCAFALGLIALALDIATERQGVQVVEELLEVGAETTFLLAMLNVADAKQRQAFSAPAT